MTSPASPSSGHDPTPRPPLRRGPLAALGVALIGTGTAAGLVAGLWLSSRPLNPFLAGQLAGSPATPPGQRVGTNASPPPEAPPVEVTLTALIDGSDRFVFAGENLWNEHLRWQAPQQVTFNGEAWTDLTTAPPSWASLARDLDLSRARIVTREGRDIVALETTPDGFDLVIADTPMGAGRYSVTLSIPRRKTSPSTTGPVPVAPSPTRDPDPRR